MAFRLQGWEMHAARDAPACRHQAFVATAIPIPAVLFRLNIPDTKMQCQIDRRRASHFIPIYGIFNNSYSLEVATLSNTMLNQCTGLTDTKKRKTIHTEILNY